VLTLCADVNSTTGTLGFDVNSDGANEAVLNSTGLGIGTSSPSSALEVTGNAIVTGALVVGGTVNTSQSNLHVSGTIAFNPASLAAGSNTIGGSSLVMVDTSSGNAVLTLPDASAYTAQMFTIKRSDVNNEVYLVAGGNTMDNYATMILGSGQLGSVQLMSNGTSWYVLGQSAAGVEGVSNNELFLAWGLEESSGNTAADTGATSSRSGTLGNNHQFSGNTTTGVLGSALQLGNSDTVLYDSGGLPTTGYAYSLWVNYSKASSDTLEIEPHVEGKAGFVWASGNSKYHMSAFHQLDAAGNIASTAITSTANLAANTWYHIAASWNGSTLDLYLNGRYESGNTATTWVAGTNVLLTNPGAFQDSTIKVDDLRFYNNSLSANQIQSLYHLGSP
jgi:hypothetical protein